MNGWARAMVLAAVSAGAAGAQQTPAEAWRRDAEALRARPGLVRFYSLKSGEAAQTNWAGSAEALQHRPEKGLAVTTEVGRVAGLRAVVLDADAFEAPALTQVSNCFTVSVWLRPIALGSKRGNAGSSNGMIACSGSGYTDGWRLAIYDWRTRQPALDLGREKGAFQVRARDGLSAGFWNHVAATWDGATVRLYVNGILSAVQPYEGPAVAPKSALRLGYANYGVGSLRMAADELAIFGAALQPEEVAALTLVGAPLPAALAPSVRRAQELAASDDAAACEAFARLASSEGAPAAWKAWAQLAGACRRQGGAAQASALFESPSAPAVVRGQAAELLVQQCRQGAGGELPSRLLAKLPESLELDAGLQRTFALALGASLAREGDAAGAVRVYEQLLSADDAPPADEAGVRFACAQALRQAGRWADARAHYEKVQAEGRAPAYVCGLAAVAAAQTLERAGDLKGAAEAFRRAAALSNQVAHVRAEAEAGASACENRLAGRPARDPEAGRERLRPPPAPAVEYFVAPDGDDAGPGSQDRPFATLERARDAVRANKVQGLLPRGGAAVWLRGGRYAVTNTFALTPADSGSFGAPVAYRAWRDERPVFDGGFRVKGLRKLSDPAELARLPAEARGAVRVADLRAQGCPALTPQKSYGYGIANKTVRELFEDGAPLPVARWPNEGALKIEAVIDGTNHVFACKTERAARWTGAAELMANGYWQHLWAGCTVPVKAFDAASGAFTLKEKPGYAITEGRPFYVLNLLEEIDRPGEWYLDAKSGLLYVWPVRHPWFSEFVLTRWDRPFIEAKGVRDVSFHGLTFEYGQQHALVLDGCVNAVVSGCVVRRMGGTALTALNSANLKVYGNLLHTLGHGGMHVSGGNRRNLTSGRVVIENNEVREFGRLSRTYNPALLLEGCGARVAHNWFHGAPSSAMRIEGNDHLIEYNQVDHVVRESDDQGAIDMWGNPSYRGVVIRFNRWQDIGGGEIPCGQAGIRFDDAISGMVVYGNWFERCSNGHFGGVQIHGGHLNIVDNNVFLGCRYGVSFSPWGEKRWIEYLNRDSVKRQALEEVNVMVPPYSARYPELADILRKVDVNSAWRNVFAGAEQAFHKPVKGLDAWDNYTYSSLPDLNALSAVATFCPLPLAEIGLYDDPSRARE